METRTSRSQSQQKLRSVGRWYIGETLGKGGYSWVKKGYDKRTGKPVALKFMAKADESWVEEQRKQVITEIEALKQVRHPNVMKLYAYNLNAKYPTKDNKKIDVILLVLEYAPGGELFDILYYTSALEEDISRSYFYQLMLGLEACHNAGIVHRDIKPQNLLLDSSFNLKITDFGLSKVFESDGDVVMHTSYVGTQGYQPPELLLRRPYDLSCDIFSAGVVLFILLTGYPPFENASRKDRWFQPLIIRNYKRFWKGHRGCAIQENPLARDLIQRMLEFEPRHRITIDEIKEHPWIHSGPILEGKDLVTALQTRHRRMEIKRRNDLQKTEDFRNSVTRRPIPMSEDALPPLFPQDSIQQIKDIRTTTNHREIAEQIWTVLCSHGAVIDIDENNYKFVSTVKLRKQSTDPSSLVKFQVCIWRESKNSEYNIVRFKRLEGDPYDFFKVRQLLDKYCNPVFTGISSIQQFEDQSNNILDPQNSNNENIYNDIYDDSVPVVA